MTERLQKNNSEYLNQSSTIKANTTSSHIRKKWFKLDHFLHVVAFVSFIGCNSAMVP